MKKLDLLLELFVVENPVRVQNVITKFNRCLKIHLNFELDLKSTNAFKKKLYCLRTQLFQPYPTNTSTKLQNSTRQAAVCCCSVEKRTIDNPKLFTFGYE